MNTLIASTFGEMAGIALIIIAFLIGFAILIGIVDNGWPDFRRKK